MSAPILDYPDYSKAFILDTDASDVGIGAVLSQIQDNGSESVIAYASWTFSRQEQKYCVTRKELLAVVEFTRHFRPYLLGKKFTLRTYHSSLVWMQNFKEPEGKKNQEATTVSKKLVDGMSLPPNSYTRTRVGNSSPNY